MESMNIKEGNNQQMNASNSCSVNNNNNSIVGRDSSSSPTSFQQNQVSMDWTPEEQATLEEGLVKYASETSISRYAKIAIALKNKTVRDVALRCKWTTKKENSRRKKDDANLLKKNKDRKEKLTDPTAVVSAPVVMQQPGYAPYSQGVVSNKSEGFVSYHATVNVTTQLIHQNARIFEQISANLVTHQIHENTRLLCQARDNIIKILHKYVWKYSLELNESSCTLKQMPPLPVKLNEELANSILPPSTHALG
ncbi:putative protein isoform X1 [Capsicum annuum]|uniref:uncharacterized protein LOC107847961 isoform X1 n=1 Tax=Capsicum annuum TaxID=4072 RepID=UPI0007BEEE01|nr:uncharacterized protein LOC107847961 isoform X1 [Capsicum annuum]